MPVESATREKPSSDLRGLVVALDVDNTLLHLGADTYARTVREFLALHDLGVPSDDAVRAYEALRAGGGALARLGLGNPLHLRGHPHALAALCLTAATNPRLLRDLDLDGTEQVARGRVLADLFSLHRATRTGSIEVRVAAERQVRHFCRYDRRAEHFCVEVRRVAALPLMQSWSRQYATIEDRLEPDVDVRTPLQTLISRGATLVAISEGLLSVQTEKLARRGLLDLFAGCVLATETAAAAPGAEALHARLDDALEERHEAAPEQVRVWWYFRDLLEMWAWKSPWFYARCLHAATADSSHPQAALQALKLADAQAWRGRPLRLVMIGDRHDKDIQPLLDLFGPGIGLKVRLRQGKYAHLDPEMQLPPERRPDYTFSNWDELGDFLLNRLPHVPVVPVESPPDILPRGEISKDDIATGLRSDLEVVRRLAAAARTMLSWTRQ